VTTTSEGDTRMRGIDVQVRGVIHLYQQDGPDIVALRGIDLDIGAGEMVALLGPSGMGKSTLMQLMAGVMRPSAGHIRVGDVDLGQLSATGLRRLRAREVSFVLQDTSQNLLPSATAVENVWFAQQGNRQNHEVQDPSQLLTLLGLADIAHHRVGDLPSGQQQLVALASGVGPSPRLLLADEPTNQLDSEAATLVIELLHAINQRLGTTIVLVTHDPVVAAALPRTVTIRDGRVGAEGRRGVQYAVVDGSGSVQLPAELMEHFPPLTRLIVREDAQGIHLSPADPEERNP
jgi:putative ABC transport system ATP-binding protein